MQLLHNKVKIRNVKSSFLTRLVVVFCEIKVVIFIQWRSQDFSKGFGGSLGATALGDFCNFSIKITHF